jgi:hypothetical protein
MKKALIGMVAGVALVGLGATARADDTSMGSSTSTTMKKDTTTYEGLNNQLTGRVVKTDSSTVWVEHLGAVIPLKVDSNTRFDSASIQRAKDLKEGQEIRASFTINNKTDNLAKSISLSSATGGSGLDTGVNDTGNALPKADKPY